MRFDGDFLPISGFPVAHAGGKRWKMRHSYAGFVLPNQALVT
jgi:hypothetical protein